jgi:hypothetical protein
MRHFGHIPCMTDQPLEDREDAEPEESEAEDEDEDDE